MHYSLMAWIVVGAIAGWITSLLVGKDFRGGCCGLVLIGMLGAVLGGALFRLAGGVPMAGVNIHSVVVAVVGSLVLLWLVRLAAGRREK